MKRYRLFVLAFSALLVLTSCQALDSPPSSALAPQSSSESMDANVPSSSTGDEFGGASSAGGGAAGTPSSSAQTSPAGGSSGADAAEPVQENGPFRLAEEGESVKTLEISFGYHYLGGKIGTHSDPAEGARVEGDLASFRMQIPAEWGLEELRTPGSHEPGRIKCMVYAPILKQGDEDLLDFGMGSVERSSEFTDARGRSVRMAELVEHNAGGDDFRLVAYLVDLGESRILRLWFPGSGEDALRQNRTVIDSIELS